MVAIEAQPAALSLRLLLSCSEEVVVESGTIRDVFGGSGPSGTVYGHEYVDLGLRVKWAACNMGASSLTDYGDYYDATYDAARANWGGGDEGGKDGGKS